ncbi:MAG TPA: hypothetical protein VM712_06715, partial [Gaiellales bacterium]|nr:hypothetical protein [Gaiellales bacterium]
TLNDRRAPAGRADDLQAIVTGALGGEQRIHVRSGSDPGRTAELADGDGKTLARLERVGGRWVGERVRPPRSGGYVPSTGGGSS